MGVAILISDKIDFKIKIITRNKERYHIMIKGSIQEKDVMIIHLPKKKKEALQYIRQMLTTIKGEIIYNTIIFRDFNTPLTPMDRSSRWKINTETHASINDTCDQMNLIDIYRTFIQKH